MKFLVGFNEKKGTIIRLGFEKSIDIQIQLIERVASSHIINLCRHKISINLMLRTVCES